MSTSIDSLSSASATEKAQSASGVFERLKDGESLTGWRHSPTSPRNDAQNLNSSEKPEGNRDVANADTNHSDMPEKDKISSNEQDAEVAIPKLGIELDIDLRGGG